MTASVAVIVAAVVVTFLTAFTATPDPVMQLVNGAVALVVTGVVLLIILQLRWMRALPENRQKRVVWLVAASTGFAVCWLPLLLVLFRP